MFSQEEIDSWNEIFTESRIDASDLAQPSETFLARTLSAYLRVLGYNVPEYHYRPDDVTSAEKRQFLIRLAWNIDRVLKITNGAYNFTYYDLIRATAKKTQHIFGILLNYLYYYNMYKKTVFNLATERIQKLEDVQRNISEAKVENERCLATAEQMETQKAILAEKLPKAEEKLKSMSDKIVKQKDDMERLERTIGELSNRTKDLTIEKNNLHKQTVSDDEARDLKAQHSKLKLDIEEQQRKEQLIQTGCQEHINTTKELNEICQLIEQALEIVPNHMMKAKDALTKNLATSNQQIKELENKCEKYKSEISKKENELELLIKKQDQLTDEMKRKQEITKNVIAAKEREVKENDLALEKLKEQEQDLSAALSEQLTIKDFLNQVLPELMANCRNSETN